MSNDQNDTTTGLELDPVTGYPKGWDDDDAGDFLIRVFSLTRAVLIAGAQEGRVDVRQAVDILLLAFANAMLWPKDEVVHFLSVVIEQSDHLPECKRAGTALLLRIMDEVTVATAQVGMDCTQPITHRVARTIGKAEHVVEGESAKPH